MQYTSDYVSPIGKILLAADDLGLVGLWFEGQKYFASNLESEHQERDLPLFETVRKWLDIRFFGKRTRFCSSPASDRD